MTRTARHTLIRYVRQPLLAARQAVPPVQHPEERLPERVIQLPADELAIARRDTADFSRALRLLVIRHWQVIRAERRVKALMARHGD